MRPDSEAYFNVDDLVRTILHYRFMIFRHSYVNSASTI